VFFNFNGNASLELREDSPGRYRWWVHFDDRGNQMIYYVNSQFSADNIPNPFDQKEVSWTWGFSESKPVPTFTFGEEGYYPSDSETTGLPMVKDTPQLGRIYNDDATVRIAAMYPAK
jgi:hypothetical protein